MSTSSTLSVDTAPARSGSKQNPSRFFYSATAAVLLVLMFLGFRQFYLHGRAFPDRPLAPPILELIILHGAGMTLWMVLALVQPLLIVNRKRKLHRQLGMSGAILATIIFVSGLILAVESAQLAPPEARIWNLSFKEFMIVPIVSILLFGGFVLMGIIYRNQPKIHRPMMLLASLAAVTAAIDRIPSIASLYNTSLLGAVLGPFASTFLLGLLLLALLSLLTRSFDRAFFTGWLVTTLSGAAAMQIAVSPAWNHITNFLFLH